MVPGGFNSTATEIQQEGLRLPPVKLMRRGEIVQDIVDIILNNIRVPEERIGDIRAQIGALKTGERRLTVLLDRYGPETVEEGIVELKARSERQMRACIESVPDGVYRFTSYIDSDGVVNEPLAIALEMTVEGSDIVFDFSRSSPPCRGPMNCVWATTQSAVYVAIKHIFPEVPINAGCFAPLHIPVRERTFLYAQYPRPVAGCAAEVAQRIMEAVFGAMGAGHPRAHVRKSRRHERQFRAGRLGSGARRRLHHVLLLGRRLRRLVGDGWADQRLLVGRHIQDSARRDPGAALPDPCGGIRSARRLGRSRPASRRLRHQLPTSACCAERESLLSDGPRTNRAPRLA